jgi:hypothetical protein
MLRESHTAVVGRNEIWEGSAASEPYEAGWALEAIVWLRVLAVEGPTANVEARVQISPDGIHWVDEGTRFAISAVKDGLTFARVSHFGNWLRVAANLPAGMKLTMLVSITVKG